MLSFPKFKNKKKSSGCGRSFPQDENQDLAPFEKGQPTKTPRRVAGSHMG